MEDKTDRVKFDWTLNQLHDMGLADLKIVEDLSIDLDDGDGVLETEDTLTLLDKYIDGIDLKVDSTNVKNIMRSLYVEACEI